MKSNSDAVLAEGGDTAPLKIIHLANHVLEIGNGIVNVMIDLACSQADAGHDVTVASAGGEFEALLAKHGVKHIDLVQQPKLSQLFSLCWKFNRIVSREKPDIVHAHMMTGMLVAKLVRFGRPYRLVSTVHNEFQRSAIVMGLADRVVAVGSAVAASMARRGVSAKRLRTVGNGTINSPRRPRSDDSGRENTAVPELMHPNVVTVAGMYHRKGIGVLIQAFSKIELNDRQPNLYVVGDGPDRAGFEAQAMSLGLHDRVHFLGFRADAPALLAQADVFTLASFRDPFPLVVIEAREAGCAIVASDVDGIPEAVGFGDAGMLVQPGDSEALTQALQAMLSDDVAREGWRARAKRNLAWFEVSRVSHEYLSVYEEVVGRAAPGVHSSDRRVDLEPQPHS